jgi:lysozyme
MNHLEHLKLSEGLRLKAYQDSLGVWTIGYGRNLQSLQITEKQAEEWLIEDYNEAKYMTERLMDKYGISLSQTRKEVLTEMMFNLGYPRLSGFTKFLAALQQQAYDRAVSEMLDSRWARQVQWRADRLAAVMKADDWGILERPDFLEYLRRS